MWHVLCTILSHSFSGRSSPGPLEPVRTILVVRFWRTQMARSVGTLFASNATTAVPDSTNRQYLSKSLWDGSCQELCPRLNSALHGFSYLVLSWSLTSKDPIRLVDFFFCQSERRQKLFSGHLILKIEIHQKSVYSNHLYNCVQISNLISTANFFSRLKQY